MKNIELYRTIEALVQNRKEDSSPGKPSFAHQYCNQQIQKKKLIPFNPSSKMNRIMKNFHQLETYVNVEQLFDSLNVKAVEKKRDNNKKEKSVKWSSNHCISFDNNETMEKVRKKLGPYLIKRNLKEAKQIDSISMSLEKESNLGTLKKSNHSPQGNYEQIIKVLQKRPDENFQGKKWNYYENTGYSVPKGHQIKSLTINQREYREKLQEKRQRADLIHQVSTYLQIILENRHKKKWGYKNKDKDKNEITNQHQKVEKQESKQNFRSCRNSLLTSRIITNKSVTYEDEKRDLAAMTETNSPRLKKQFSHTKSIKNINLTSIVRENNKLMKQSFTFRNRNIKKVLMRKIGNFVDFVESEEKQIKKEKGSMNLEINRLEAQLKARVGEESLAEDNEVEEVQHIVHMQR